MSTIILVSQNEREYPRMIDLSVSNISVIFELVSEITKRLKDEIKLFHNFQEIFESKTFTDGTIQMNTFENYKIKDKSKIYFYCKPQTGWTVQIFIKTLSGKTLTLDISLQNSIYQLKDLIFSRLQNIATYDMLLTFAGNELKNSSTLEECGIHKESSLCLQQIQN